MKPVVGTVLSERSVFDSAAVTIWMLWAFCTERGPWRAFCTSRTPFISRVCLGGRRLWLFSLTPLRFVMKPDPVVCCSSGNLKRGVVFFGLPGHLGHGFSPGWRGLVGWRRYTEAGGCLLLSILFVGQGTLNLYFLKSCEFSAVLVLYTGLLPSFHSVSVNNTFKLRGWKATFVEALLDLIPAQGTASMCHFASPCLYFVACSQQAPKDEMVEITLAFDRILVGVLLQDFTAGFCAHTHQHNGPEGKADVAIQRSSWAELWTWLLLHTKFWNGNSGTSEAVNCSQCCFFN